MALRPLHEIHTRRRGRNLGLGIVLAAFIAIIFGLTVSKVTRMQYDMDGDARTGAAPATQAEEAQD